jgi:hypothetical protein
MGLENGFYWAKFQPTSEWEVVRYYRDEIGFEVVYVNNEDLPYDKKELFKFSEGRLYNPDELEEITNLT